MTQLLLINDDIPKIKIGKTYRAIRHDVVRIKQSANANSLHHPWEKKLQVETVLQGCNNLKTLELFAGKGNMTVIYRKYGMVESFDKKYLKTGDSFLVFHKLIADKKKYNIVDIDSYGFPSRFFPDIFLLIEKGVLFITVPKPNVNILNGIVQTHLAAYYGSSNPTKEDIIERIVLFGLCHWRKVELISEMNLKSVWRFCFNVIKVKATDYTGVKNR